MFVKNDKYKQRELFSFESQMNARQFKLWKGSLSIIFIIYFSVS
jgi:hypothetical protein